MNERRMPAASRPWAARCSSPAPVAAQLDVRDAQRQQAMRAVGERRGDLGGRRARQVGLDEHHVAAVTHERAQPAGVEGPHGGQVGDGRVEVARRRQRLVERRPDRHDDRGVERPAPQHGQAVGVHRRRVGLLGHPDVHAVVSGECPRERGLELVGMAGDVDGPARQRRQQRDVARRLVRAARLGAVVGGAGADEDGPDVLVAQVELDLLVGALDDERRVGVHDGSQSLEGEAGGHADHELLADADVEHALVARQLGDADLGEDDRRARIVVERARRELVEALSHRGHRSTSATTACGRSPVAVSARSSASWSRPSTRAALQPSSSKRAAMPPGQW